MRHLWLAGLLFAACGGSSKPATTAGSRERAGPTCAQVSDQLIVLLSAGAKEAPTEAIDQMRIKLARQCEDGAWSVAARRCVLDAKTAADTQACDPLFTATQRDAWKSAEPSPGPASTAPPPPPAPPKSTKPASRGAPKDKAAGAASDPCDGGE